MSCRLAPRQPARRQPSHYPALLRSRHQDLTSPSAQQPCTSPATVFGSRSRHSLCGSSSSARPSPPTAPQWSAASDSGSSSYTTTTPAARNPTATATVSGPTSSHGSRVGGGGGAPSGAPSALHEEVSDLEEQPLADSRACVHACMRRTCTCMCRTCAHARAHVQVGELDELLVSLGGVDCGWEPTEHAAYLRIRTQTLGTTCEGASRLASGSAVGGGGSSRGLSPGGRTAPLASASVEPPPRQVLDAVVDALHEATPLDGLEPTRVALLVERVSRELPSVDAAAIVEHERVLLRREAALSRESRLAPRTAGERAQPWRTALAHSPQPQRTALNPSAQP